MRKPVFSLLYLFSELVKTLGREIFEVIYDWILNELCEVVLPSLVFNSIEEF